MTRVPLTARRKALVLALLAALSLLAYSNSFYTAFHFDDYHQLVKNVRLHSLGNIPRTFVDAGMGSFNPDLRGYRPLTYSSFALTWALSGTNVFGHHLANFLLHVLCAFLLYLVADAVIRKAGTEGAGGAALVIAALFAVHPVGTSAVTYISGRAAVLASFFYLLAFLAFIRYRESGPTDASRRFWMPAAPFFYILALLSKEMAVSLVGVMAAYDLLLGGAARGGGAVRRWLYYAPFLALTAGYVAVKRYLQGYVAVSESTHTVGRYLLSEAHALLIYLRVLVFPVNQNADYDLPPVASADARVAAAVVIVCALLILFYRMRKTDPALAFFGFWFFIALAPESTLVPIEDIAVEYRLYLPSAGFIAAIVLLAWRYIKGLAPARAISVSAVVLFALLSFNRNSVWATEYTFWSDAAAKSPYSARVHANLGRALIDERRYQDAVVELNRSLEIDPFFDQSYNVYNNIGTCYVKMGLMQEALDQFDRATKVYPGYSDGYFNLGSVYYALGRYGEARAALEKALAIQPDHEDARKLLQQLPM